MTEKLYYQDSHMNEFDAVVTACGERGEGYDIVLDRTAFFPEGGGQGADIGKIAEATVYDVQEIDGEIHHFSDAPLEVGSAVTGRINWGLRFQRMQNHSGEHIVSGIIHRIYGYDNVGFHMAPGEVTLDINGELSREDILKIQRLANEAAWQNLEVTAEFPTPEELKTMEYRSKLELTENVRIVTVDGVDKCACCAPHVSRTGEIGLIQITGLMRHRGGTRLTMVCGGDALRDYVEKADSVASIAAALSVKQAEVFPAVAKLKTELGDLKYQAGQERLKRAMQTLEGLKPTEGNMCFFESGLDMDSLRALVNAALPLCGGMCAGFSGSGDSWQYVIASACSDMRDEAKKINAALNGKGGGKGGMIQGSVCCGEGKIKSYFGVI